MKKNKKDYLGEDLKSADALIEKTKKYKNQCFLVIFNRPEDCPDYAICRLFVLAKPTCFYIKRVNVSQIRNEIEKYNLIWFDRMPGDDPNIVGTYIV